MHNKHLKLGKNRGRISPLSWFANPWLKEALSRVMGRQEWCPNLNVPFPSSPLPSSEPEAVGPQCRPSFCGYTLPFCAQERGPWQKGHLPIWVYWGKYLTFLFPFWLPLLHLGIKSPGLLPISVTESLSPSWRERQSIVRSHRLSHLLTRTF